MKHCKYFFIVYAIAILSSVGANAATVAGLATTDYVKGALGSLDVTTASGSGNVVTAVTQTDGKIAVTKGSITSANNPTITITQNGTTKGTFSLNQSGAATIALTDNDTKYTLPIATADALGGVKSGGDITVATDGKMTIAPDAVTSAKIADSTIVDADIASGAAIATSKINGLDTALAGKQTTENLVDTTDKIEANKTSTTKYPSMAVAQQIASTVVTKNMVNVEQKIDSLSTNYTNLSTTVENNKTAAENAIKALDSSVTNANGAISTITITDGKITNVTRKSVDTADLAAGAVTPVKTSGVIGYIPSGSATATTYAQIWVQ